MKQRTAHTVTNAIIVGQTMMADYGVWVVKGV